MQQIYDYLYHAGGPKVQYGLTYPYFTELLDHVAQNCTYTTKNVHGPYSRVRTLFHVMNSSRGRIKLARDTSETIINPLTALDSAEPTNFHNKVPAKTPPPTNMNGHIQRSQSLATPPTSNSKKKSIMMATPPSSAKSTPRRSMSIGTPNAHLNSRPSNRSTPSSLKKIPPSPRGNLKSDSR